MECLRAKCLMLSFSLSLSNSWVVFHDAQMLWLCFFGCAMLAKMLFRSFRLVQISFQCLSVWESQGERERESTRAPDANPLIMQHLSLTQQTYKCQK